MKLPGKLSRRSFLSMAAVPSIAALSPRAAVTEHHFQYDHVIGTSLDLVVWTSDARAAQRAEHAVLDEIARLEMVLNTRNPESEISRMEREGTFRSRELSEVFSAYALWQQRTSGAIRIRPGGEASALNVDALGKAYIIQRAAAAARQAAPGMDGLLLNIGGDMVALGRSCEIAVTDPSAWQDNAAPLTTLRIENAAVASSGTYARGAHLLDGRTGVAAPAAASATVVARDAVTANALATTLCVIPAAEGIPIVEATPGAEAIRIAPDGTMQRTSGFARLERPRWIRTAAVAADWPDNFEVNITLTLTNGAGARGGPGGRGGGRGGFAQRQYVAIWVENSAGKLVRVLAFWADKARYYTEMSTFYNTIRNQNRLASMARATRAPGTYHIVWDGLDDQQNPAPPGSYRIVVETNQEHGQYAKQIATIDCADKPATAMTPATSNFEAVVVEYGPRRKPA